MKYPLPVLICLFLFSTGYAQHPKSMDRGNNDAYVPFHNFAIPVASPTPIDSPLPVGNLANLEIGLEKDPVEAAGAGVHLAPGTSGAKTVRYDLYIDDTLVNYTGKKRKAISVNGALPAPTLVFTIGDTAMIYVHNQSAQPTSVHWHGVFLPNRMDGVPNLTQQAIPPHSTYLYKFPVVQDGTYWYHSHFSLQEQIGLYGILIFNKRTEPDIPTIPLMLSDWSDIRPKEIDRSLHAATDWFAIRKHATQSYSEALKSGNLGIKFMNEWKRMTAMDVSDVYYPKLLANGRENAEVSSFKAGDQVRLRLVNGGASSYFWLTYSGGKITVIANDGNDVMPVEVDRIIIAPSETYDVIVTLPGNNKYEFRATSEDRTHHASLWLGSGMEMPAPKLPRLNYFAGMNMMNKMMKMNGDMKSMGHAMSLQQMDMNRVMYPELQDKNQEMQADHSQHKMTEVPESPVIYTCPMHPEVREDHPGNCPECGMELQREKIGGKMGMPMKGDKGSLVTLNYNMLQSTEKTTLRPGPWRELKFELTGNMNRYVWTLNNKTVSESDKILIKKGENIRIILYNNSMMRHPMHLHGHDFRVLNQYGEYAPLKNVIDIMPMETDTLEFAATESGDWFFHCHILYHMMSGMGRVFSYQNSPANPELPDPEKSYRMLKGDDRMFHLMGQAGLQTNGSEGMFMLSNTRWQISQLWHIGFKPMHGFETETAIGRYIDKMQWLMPYIGYRYRYQSPHSSESNIFGADDKNMFGQDDHKIRKSVVVAGFTYTLPLLIVADARINSTGQFRLQLARSDIPLTPRLRLDLMANTDKEYMLGGRYILTKYWSLGAHYDSDMGLGAGIVFTY